ncbi:protein required for attachment to host cells [Bradyrhizobium barranii subsp. barranii]
MIKIPHHAVVFVGDGRKALFFRDEGDEKFPNLRVEAAFEDQNPATHDQGSDRPGRVSKAAHSGQRSAVETSDWHELEERRFVKQVAVAVERIVRGEPSTALIVVAPPHSGGASVGLPSRCETPDRGGACQRPHQAPGRRHRKALVARVGQIVWGNLAEVASEHKRFEGGREYPA